MLFSKWEMSRKIFDSMKKVLISTAAVIAFLFIGLQEAGAQSRFGIIGGVNFSTMNYKEINRSTMTQWHAGLTFKGDLPLGFSIQPSLIYNVKGAKTKADIDLSVGYLELPVSIQWGPDLLLFRPFLDVTPFIGYAVNGKESTPLGSTKDIWSNGIKRLEYGVGLGIGLEIWRFQVIGRYNWNFGPLSTASETFQSWGEAGKAFSEKNFSGITLSVAFLFGGKN